MSRYLLRIEGVNHRTSILDTDDLSTRRGGGLMLLNAVRDLVFGAHSLSEVVGHSLNTISTGASTGLFAFESDLPVDCEQLSDRVRQHLADSSLPYLDRNGKDSQLPLAHGSFVVDVVAVEDEANHQGEYRAWQQLMAHNRWRQMQSPSLPLSGLWNTSVETVCYFDFVRPGTEEVWVPADPTPRKEHASKSVADRRRYGQGARQKFYQQELQDDTFTQRFTDDFRTLSTGPSAKKDKLAVVYLDGNGFGKKSSEAFKSQGVAAYQAWSEALQRHHRALLKGLIEKTLQDKSWRIPKDGEELIRLETLLWGGDEILWVVPAWKGWELVEWFFGQPHEILGQAVTYSCGLVFCHANAPIGNVTSLAHQLGDEAKRARAGENSHRVAYEVLESYDDLTGDLKEHRAKWLPNGVSVDSLVLDPKALEDAWDAMRVIAASAEFPQRQLYRLCQQWREGQDYSKSMELLAEGELESPMSSIRAAFGHPTDSNEAPVPYLHLLQMLPYLSEEKPEAGP